MTKLSARWSVLLLVCALTACSPQSCSERATEEAVEKAIEAETGGEVDVDAEAGEVTIGGREGAEIEMTGGAGPIELPHDFPDVVPIYPGAVPIGFVRMGDEGLQATFRTEAEAGVVQTWYEKQLPDQGWEVQMNTTMPEGGMLVASLEEDTLTVSVSGSHEEAETALVLHLQKER